jgi:arsenate reductase-like glutaredoxin family protein
MTKLIVYSKEKNPQCEELKDALKEEGIAYQEIDIRKPEAISELRKNGCFALEPPVLQVVQDKRSRWFFKNDDLFWDGRLIRETIKDVMQISRPRTAWPY